MTNSVQSNTVVQDLARSLLETFDKNGDGKLGADEFSQFLSQLMGGIQTGAGASPFASAAQGLSAPQALTRGGLPVNPGLFEGFDMAREQNVTKSAKDAFLSLAGGTTVVPNTKPEAEAWFNQHIKSGMEQLGHKIHWVQGDKFEFSNWQGTFVVDFVRGCEGPNPAFWWGADPSGARFT
jgi:hypothetical protein